MSPGGAFILGLGVGVMFMTLVCVYVMTMAVKEDRLRRKVRAEMERDGSYPKVADGG